MDFSHNLVLIIGKRLQTNLSCYCHPSLRRKHMLFLWPQGTVPLCAELSILQGSSEDIFHEAGKCYGFSYQREVCSMSGDSQLPFFACTQFRLSWNLHGRSRLCNPNSSKLFLSSPWLRNLLLPCLISTSSGAGLPSSVWGCSRDRERSSWPSSDLACPQKAALDPSWLIHENGRSSSRSSPWYQRSRIPYFLQGKQDSFIDPIQIGMCEGSWLSTWHFQDISTLPGYIKLWFSQSMYFFPFPAFKSSWYTGLCIEQLERELRVSSLNVFFTLLLQDFRPEQCFSLVNKFMPKKFSKICLFSPWVGFVQPTIQEKIMAFLSVVILIRKDFIPICCISFWLSL